MLSKDQGIAIKMMHFFMKVYAFESFTNIPYVYMLHSYIWFCFHITLLYDVVKRYYKVMQNNSIGDLVGSALFFVQIAAHMTVTMEAFNKRHVLSMIEEAYSNILSSISRYYSSSVDLDTTEMFRKINKKMNIITFAVSICVTATTIMIILQTFDISNHWWSSLPRQAQRVRSLQIILTLIIVSEKLNLLDKALQQAAQRNQELTTNAIWMPCTDEESRVLLLFRMIYDQFYDLSVLLNNCFGWSIFIIALSYFFEFVYLTYYTFILVLEGGSAYNYVGKITGTFVLVLLITLLCWYGQQCSNKSKHIGSSICKLAKPLGNTQYNNLVSAFSLQALHQTFVVSAKEFFPLNLDLLGNMFGSIVTYLVILIQFMLTEKNGSRISVPNSSRAYIEMQNQTIDH